MSSPSSSQGRPSLLKETAQRHGITPNAALRAKVAGKSSITRPPHAQRMTVGGASGRTLFMRPLQHSGAVRHPSRIEEPDWDAFDPAPPWDCAGPWEPTDAWLGGAGAGTAGPGGDRAAYAPLAADNGAPCQGPLTRREMVEKLISGVAFQSVMAALIVANAIVIGLETDAVWEPAVWDVIEDLFLFVFTGELLLKFVAQGVVVYFDWNSADLPWNVFDFLIVTLGIVDFSMGVVFGNAGGGSISTVFRMIRLLRILRIFRIVKFLKQLYLLAFGFGLAAIAVSWVTFLMVFALYICAIVLVRTVGHVTDDDPQSEFLRRKFGSIMQAMFTLFELMSSPALGAYEEIMWVRPTMAVFLITWIIFGSFGMIALLTGVISESMFDKNNLRMEEARLERENTRRLLVRTCEELYDELPSQAGDSPGKEGAPSREVMGLLPQLAMLLESEGVHYASGDLMSMMEIFDATNTGIVSREDFRFFLVQMAEGVQPLLIMRVYYSMVDVRKTADSCEASVQAIARAREDAETQQSLDVALAPVEEEDMSDTILEEIQRLVGQVEKVSGSVDYLGERMGRLSGQVLDLTSRLDRTTAEVKMIQETRAQHSRQ